MVPMPGDPWRFEPMDEREGPVAAHGGDRQCGHTPLARFEYEHDYGSPTELDLPPGWRDWKNNDRRLCLRWDRDFWSLIGGQGHQLYGLKEFQPWRNVRFIS